MACNVLSLEELNVLLSNFLQMFNGLLAVLFCSGMGGLKMSVEAAGVMRSKPVYAVVPSVLNAGRRLLVIQDASLAEATQLHGQLSADGQPLELASLRGEAPWTGGQTSCGEFARLEVRLLSLLSTAPVGTRLYVCGDESFLWSVYRLARSR